MYNEDQLKRRCGWSKKQRKMMAIEFPSSSLAVPVNLSDLLTNIVVPRWAWGPQSARFCGNFKIVKGLVLGAFLECYFLWCIGGYMQQSIFTHWIRNLHNLLHTVFHRTRDTVISIVTRLRAGRSGICVPAGTGDFSFHKSIPALGPTQPPIHWVLSRRSCEIGAWCWQLTFI
jgi:hypothetical protein